MTTMPSTAESMIERNRSGRGIRIRRARVHTCLELRGPAAQLVRTGSLPRRLSRLTRDHLRRSPAAAITTASATHRSDGAVDASAATTMMTRRIQARMCIDHGDCRLSPAASLMPVLERCQTTRAHDMAR